MGPTDRGLNHTPEAPVAETERELPVNFATFVVSLASSAMLHLGEVPNPASGSIEKNLPLARNTIDLLDILQDKTQGNLDGEERQLLDTVLADLRLKYVAASNAS